MHTLLLALALSTPAADQPAPQVEGKWLIVYAEEGGRRNDAWEQQRATIHGDTLSYMDNGKERTLKLTFGPHQLLEASGGEGKEGNTGKGVYIASQDYLCLSLSSGHFSGDSSSGAKEGAEGDKNTSSGSFILILRRQRMAKPPQP